MSRNLAKWLILCLASVLLLGVTGCASSEPKENDTGKVAMLMEGPMNDGGWNVMAYEALKKLESELGVGTAYTDNLTTDKMAATERQYAMQGYDVIIGHGYAFGDSMLEVAEEFPDVKFIVYGGEVQNGKNLASVQYAYGQAGALIGATIGTTAGITKVGVVGAFENATSMTEFKNAEEFAKKNNPNIEFSYVFTGDFNDVTKGKEAALASLAEGAQVILTDMSAPAQAILEAVQQHDAYMVLVMAGDISDSDPDSVMVCGIHDAVVSTFACAQNAFNGSFKGEVYQFGMAEKAIYLSDFGNMVTTEQIEAVKTLEDSILNNEVTLMSLVSDD